MEYPSTDKPRDEQPTEPAVKKIQAAVDCIAQTDLGHRLAPRQNYTCS
jgi:hypothetical protein